MKAIRSILLLLLALCLQLPAQAPNKTVQEKLGYPATARLLVIHVDDVGMSHSVNRATFEAFEKGWITSASILVPCPWFQEVATWAKAHPDADLGIHLALNSEWTGYRWGPVASSDKVPSLIDEQGYLPILETLVIPRAKPDEVALELHAQVAKAKSAGIHLSHLDSHMTTLLQSKPLIEEYRRAGRDFGLPVILYGAEGKRLEGYTAEDSPIDQVISIGTGIDAKDWFNEYKKMLGPLKPGVYELIIHLAYDDDEMRGATWDHPNWGAAWRQHDVDLIQSPEFRQYLKDQGFILVQWKDLAKVTRINGEK